jgi:TP901 family phage tail tape measure protein
MAQKFVLTAALNIQAPNMNKVVRNINQQLQGVSVNLNVPNAAKTNKAIQNVNKNLKNTAKDAKVAATSMQKLGASIGSTIGQFIKYDIARAAINLFSRAITDGLSDAIKFEREMVKIAQVTGATAGTLKDLEKSITRVSTQFGVASMSLLQASRVLSQTGKSAEDVKIALESLAKTTLAPTFDSLIDTTETAIAVMAQFKIEAKDLERVLGSINAVAGKFAVEAGDLGVAIKRAGGAFRSAGGEVNELIALFTSVRATTRETAETIATGFRTIFTRLQRPTTIKFLRQFGVELQDLNGKFVGPYEAVRKLHLVLKDLDPRDVRYSQIVEQLGGFRQVSKVIPLIQQFQDAQSALNVAQAGGNSLAIDAAKAQDTFAVKITKLKEEVKELFRVISESDAFRVMLDGAIGLAKALTNIATALGPIIPMLTTMFAIKGIGALGSIGRNIGRGISTQGGRAFARGGIVPGTGTGDTVPAMLTPGEFVIRKKAVKAFGAGGLAEINKYAKGGKIEATGKGLRKYGYGVGLLFNEEGDRDWDKNKGRRWKESGSVVNQFGLTDSFKATNVIKRVDLDARRFRNKSIEPSVLAYQQADEKNNKLAQGMAWEKLMFATEEMSQPKKVVRGKPLDGIDKAGQIGDAALTTSSHTASAMAEKLFRHRYLSESNFLTNRKASYGRDNYSLGTVAEFIPSAATNAKLITYGQKKKPNPKIPRGATGGMLTAQGTDSIPAMLTPGEFVVNKKSAQAIGYNKLHTINGYASGGVVGGGKRAKMFMGGGPMDMLSMFLMGGMGGGGGGGDGGGNLTSSANNTSSALNGLAKQTNTTSGKLRSSFGAVTSGLGNVATASLKAYSYVQFFGAALDSTITAMGIENEAIHKAVGGLTNFVTWIYTASVALQALQSTQILQGLGGMFNAVKGSQLAQAIGPRLGDLMGMIVGDKTHERWYEEGRASKTSCRIKNG